MLCDTGPLVALVDSQQPQHSICRKILSSSPKPLRSTWACLTEAMYLLSRTGGLKLQDHLLKLCELKLIIFQQHSDSEILRIRQLMNRYENVPMDFADASLMSVAEVTGDRRVFTLDNDFRIYRFDDGGFFEVAP